MQYQVTSVEDYMSQVPEDRKEALSKLRNVIKTNIPKGFEETLSYGMVGYVVPHTLYPNGYHCSPALPLPFMSFASQKNSINLYHMGIYIQKDLNNWFVRKYSKYSKRKLDMGKSCLRFKKTENIPYQLIGELASKITVDEWITIYENSFVKK